MHWISRKSPISKQIGTVHIITTPEWGRGFFFCHCSTLQNNIIWMQLQRRHASFCTNFHVKASVSIRKKTQSTRIHLISVCDGKKKRERGGDSLCYEFEFKTFLHSIEWKCSNTGQSKLEEFECSRVYNSVTQLEMNIWVHVQHFQSWWKIR